MQTDDKDNQNITNGETKKLCSIRNLTYTAEKQAKV
jgi:hypothetical protein